jgi:hypothetical protein
MNEFKKGYIAGPDVFFPNAQERAMYAKMLAESLGFKALVPVDNEVHENTPQNTSKAVFSGNIEMLKEADFIIANISPFRGPSADPGTVWEIGFAYALGKPIFAYTSDTNDYLSKVNEMGLVQNCMVENFGDVDNLMIIRSLNSLSYKIEEAMFNAHNFYRNENKKERTIKRAKALV